MADVFISYSKADHAIAKSLADDLVAAGFEVWWDFQLYAGDDFHNMIREEIAKAKAVIVIWSETAVASKWVRGEAVEASEHGTLISTHIPGFDTRKVPINFKALHCEPVGNRERVIAAVHRKGARPHGQKAHLADVEMAHQWRVQAESGNATAQANLAWCYSKGRGVAKDESEAARLYRLAADQNHPPALCSLGFFYRHGCGGLAKDEKEAARLYRRAADKGYALGQNNLGYLYEIGIGVAKDTAEAARLYKLAAQQRHKFAQTGLARLYERGDGVPKDLIQAMRLYKLAALEGDDEATAALERLGSIREARPDN